MTTNPIVKAALACRTVADVAALEDLLREALDRPQDRYLGDFAANWSAVSGPGDAAAVLFERNTNMWDAIIEMLAQRAGRSDWPTPAAAAADLLGVVDGVGKLSNDDRDRIARMATITLHDSDSSAEKPTISFRDLGIGLTPTEMPDTILSLQRSNKLSKPYLHGLFGKGGSSASMFSDATVIVTRKQPDLLAPDETDRVAVAVVREDDRPEFGLPYYRYLVDAANLPFSVPAEDAPGFEGGTLVIHVNYQGGKLGTSSWMFEESIYAYAETLLFRPTIPYSLHDARTGKANRRPEGRQKPSSLSGLGQRLEHSKGDGLLNQSNWSVVPVAGVGDVRMRWWLYASPDHRRKRAAKGYSVLFTSNGQVHHAWDHVRLQHFVERFRRVALRLIAEVDCDGLDLKMRARLFDSFRSQVRKGPEGKALEEAVIDALAGDPDLEEQESEFARQCLQSSGQQVSEAFRRRLNKAIKLKIPGLRALAARGREPQPPRPRRSVELYDEPTTFSGPEKMTVLVGGRGAAYLELNAVDGFVPDRAQVTATSESGSPEMQFGVADLRRGRLRFTVLSPAAATPGVYAVDLALVWERAVGGTAKLDWTIKVNVVTELAEPKPTITKPKKADVGDVAFIWSKPSEQENWTSDVAGELQEIKGSTLAEQYPKVYGDLRKVTESIPTVVLNEEFKDFAAYRTSIVRKLGDRAMDERKERFGLALGVMVANLFGRERHRRRQEDQAESRGDTVERTAMTDPQLLRAVTESARGILALMPDFDVLLGDLGGPIQDDGSEASD